MQKNDYMFLTDFLPIKSIMQLMIYLGVALTFSGTLIFITLLPIIIFSHLNPAGFIPLITMGFITFPLGIVILKTGLKIKKRETAIDTILGQLESYRRVQLSELAKKTRYGLDEVEAIVTELIANDKLEGFIDRGTKEFVHHSVSDVSKKNFCCQFCGSPFANVLLKGEKVTCTSYCRMQVI